MSSTQVLLAHFPEQFHDIPCKHTKIYAGVVEKEEEGMYQIGWAMYLFEDPEHTQPSETPMEQVVQDLSLSPDDLNAVLDAFQALPSIYGDDEYSCQYKLVMAH